MSRTYYSIYGPYIVKFIELKNSLGYKYADAGWALSMFYRLSIEKKISEIAITKEFMGEYCMLRPNEAEKTRYNRIQCVSQFARFLSDLGFRSYIPKIRWVKSNFVPYIFTKEEMQTIFTVCDNLVLSHNRNTPKLLMPVIIRLLYSTGIRISEALYLTCNDINIKDKYLILRNCKNGKDRMVPLSDSLAKVCEEYWMYRPLFPSSRKLSKENRFFIKPDGSPVSALSVYNNFRKIIFFAHIPYGGRNLGPRLHDLRHTFSVHSLASMAESGLDLYYSLPLLSTYLGHTSLKATDSYVRLTAEMYPGLIKNVSDICSSVFPLINTNIENDETN